MDLLAKEVVQGFITGLHKSPFHGFSVEFAEHRQYNKGESTRHLDWKLYARTDRLYVKQYEEETNLRANFILDTSSSMFYPQNSESLSKYEYAVLASAVLIEILFRQRDAFGLSLFSQDIMFESAIKSTPAHKEFLLKKLEEALVTENREGKETDLVEVLHRKAESMPSRSLVLLFSDMIVKEDKKQDLWEAFRHLTHQKHDVIVFHLMDLQTEQLLDFDSRQTKFVDLESGDSLVVNPETLRANYKAVVNKQIKELRNELLQLKVDLCEVDVQAPFDALMRAYLSRRKKILQSKRF